MRITHLDLKYFRCFETISFSLDYPIILFIGSNGAGKSSIIEALHYLCYLRSFRTHRPSDLIHEQYHNFFIKIFIVDRDSSHTVQVGASSTKKLVKINNTTITSYKELLDHYCVVTVTEDDLELIKEGPDIRRTFLDQAISLFDYEYIKKIQVCKRTVDNRNAFIKRRDMPWEEYLVWSEQLWDISLEIQSIRQTMLTHLGQGVNHLLSRYYADENLTISFTYVAKNTTDMQRQQFFRHIYRQEQVMSRSLFGAHLDDYQINFQQRKSRSFASRGQQKLIVLLMKIAYSEFLIKQKSRAVIMLLDDFMTDFDLSKATILLSALSDLNIQLIFTSPQEEGALGMLLKERHAQVIKLTD